MNDDGGGVENVQDSLYKTKLTLERERDNLSLDFLSCVVVVVFYSMYKRKFMVHATLLLALLFTSVECVCVCV